MYVLLINCIIVGFFFNRLANKHDRSGANNRYVGVICVYFQLIFQLFLVTYIFRNK